MKRTHRRQNRGTTLIELVTATMCSVVVGAGLVMFARASYQAQDFTQGQTVTDSEVRHALDVMADSIRNAQAYLVQSSPAVYSAISSAGASSITIYTDSAGDTAEYWLDTSSSPYVLRKTVGTASTVIETGVSSLTLTYYVSGGSYNASSSSWVTTSNPHVPTATELPNVAAISANCTVSINGYTRQFSTLVRLRNSPL